MATYLSFRLGSPSAPEPGFPSTQRTPELCLLLLSVTASVAVFLFLFLKAITQCFSSSVLELVQMTRAGWWGAGLPPDGFRLSPGIRVGSTWLTCVTTHLQGFPAFVPPMRRWGNARFHLGSSQPFPALQKVAGCCLLSKLSFCPWARGPHLWECTHLGWMGSGYQKNIVHPRWSRHHLMWHYMVPDLCQHTLPLVQTLGRFD